MPKYKVLSSVAHNVGHSFLSDMNTMDRFMSFVPQHLFEIARDSDEAEVRIDLIGSEIEPAVFDVPAVRESAAQYRSMLLDLADRMGASAAMIKGASLRLRFDLMMSRASPRRPVFECEVTILDDRGRSHVGTPDHWWR